MVSGKLNATARFVGSAQVSSCRRHTQERLAPPSGGLSVAGSTASVRPWSRHRTATGNLAAGAHLVDLLSALQLIVGHTHHQQQRQCILRNWIGTRVSACPRHSSQQRQLTARHSKSGDEEDWLWWGALAVARHHRHGQKCIGPEHLSLQLLKLTPRPCSAEGKHTFKSPIAVS